MQRRASCRALLGCLLLIGAAGLHAQPLLSSVQLITNPAAAAETVPPAQTFTITQAGSYTVTLTDLQTPVALASLQLAVADASASVLQLTGAGTTASQSVMLQPGAYTEQVLATAAGGSLGGSFSVQVAAPDGSAVPVTAQGATSSTPAFVGAVSPPSSPVLGQSVLQTDFTVSDAGSYQLIITDDDFPAAMAANSLNVALWNDAAPGTLLLTQTNTNPGTFALGSLPSGTYHLIVIGQAAAPALAALYGVSVTGGASGTSTPLAMSVPVGNLPAATLIPIQGSATLTLSLADLAVPAALTSLQAIVLQGASVLQPAVGAGTYSVAGATAGQVSLYVLAEPPTTGEGAFAAVVTSGTQTLLDLAQPVTDSTHDAYAFTTTLNSAGSYQLQINDFGIPAALSSLRAAVEQGAVLLGTSTAASGGSAMVSQQLQAGTVNLLAFAAPSASTGTGLFGLGLTSATGSAVYQTTQGVGSGFHAQSVTVNTSGNYTVSLVDLGFPANFAQLDLIATTGDQIVGQVDGGGSVSLSAAPGLYTFNILAQTGKTQGGSAANYGLYGLQLTGPTAQTTTSPSTTGSGGGGAVSGSELGVLLAAFLWLQYKRHRRGATAAHLRHTAHS